MAPIAKYQQVATARSIIATLVDSKFYGEVQFKFESGNIVHVRGITNMKIENEAIKFQVLMGETEDVTVPNGSGDTTTE